jgi:hypothetical protein
MDATIEPARRIIARLLEADAQFFWDHHYLDPLLAGPVDDWLLYKECMTLCIVIWSFLYRYLRCEIRFVGLMPLQLYQILDSRRFFRMVGHNYSCGDPRLAIRNTRYAYNSQSHDQCVVNPHIRVDNRIISSITLPNNKLTTGHMTKLDNATQGKPTTK